MRKKKRRIQQIQNGKQSVLNLSSIKLCNDDHILLGTGLKFCPKTNSHDKIKLAEKIFKFTRKIRLKEYFNSQDSNGSDNDKYRELPFYNNSSSSFIPPTGRDVYLDFYVTAITEEILQGSRCNLSVV